MLKRVQPKKLPALAEGERFLTAGKITSVQEQEKRTLFNVNDTTLIYFHKLNPKEGDTVRVIGRKGRELPIADGVHKVSPKYPQLLNKKKEQLVEDLGGM